jgi:hypothetical protein
MKACHELNTGISEESRRCPSTSVLSFLAFVDEQTEKALRHPILTTIEDGQILAEIAEGIPSHRVCEREVPIGSDGTE